MKGKNGPKSTIRSGMEVALGIPMILSSHYTEESSMKRTNRGSALLIAMITATSVAAITVSFFIIMAVRQASVFQTHEGRKAKQAAETGANAFIVAANLGVAPIPAVGAEITWVSDQDYRSGPDAGDSLPFYNQGLYSEPGLYEPGLTGPAPPPNERYPGQPYPGQPYPGQPYPGEPYPGEPYPYPNEPYYGEPTYYEEPYNRLEPTQPIFNHDAGSYTVTVRNDGQNLIITSTGEYLGTIHSVTYVISAAAASLFPPGDAGALNIVGTPMKDVALQASNGASLKGVQSSALMIQDEGIYGGSKMSDLVDGIFNGVYGPYVIEFPENPFSDSAAVKEITNNKATAGDVTSGNSGGWLYNKTSGGIWLDRDPGYDW